MVGVVGETPHEPRGLGGLSVPNSILIFVTIMMKLLFHEKKYILSKYFMDFCHFYFWRNGPIFFLPPPGGLHLEA